MINAVETVTQAALTTNLTSIEWLDFYFPFFIFFYGLALHLVLEIPQLVALAQKKMPSQYATFEKHRKIAVLSLYIGGIWSLQNIWLS